jgi:hypothetical protein
MSRLSREDQSWDCGDPEHAQNASELPKLQKYYSKEAMREKKTQERNFGWVSLPQASIHCINCAAYPLVEPTGRSKRKRQAFAIGDLHTCVCRETADPQSDNVIPCKQMGCKSKWVSFH